MKVNLNLNHNELKALCIVLAVQSQVIDGHIQYLMSLEAEALLIKLRQQVIYPRKRHSLTLSHAQIMMLWLVDASRFNPYEAVLIGHIRMAIDRCYLSDRQHREAFYNMQKQIADGL